MQPQFEGLCFATQRLSVVSGVRGRGDSPSRVEAAVGRLREAIDEYTADYEPFTTAMAEDALGSGLGIILY